MTVFQFYFKYLTLLHSAHILVAIAAYYLNIFSAGSETAGQKTIWHFFCKVNY